ncbi:MAG: hypothetical protein JSS96_16355, partial [Bacteroidetes bacterium]|nr:hypothetical protein [Bacteroidota bacterium]
MKSMLQKILSILLAILISFSAKAQLTPFEQSGGTQSATYEQVIAFYKALAAKYPSVQMDTAGSTD